MKKSGTRNKSKLDPREKDVITAEEYDLLTSRPHSKEDLAYIAEECVSNNGEYEYSDDPEFDITTKDLRKMDSAFREYFEKHREKSKFNPDDVVEGSCDKCQSSLIFKVGRFGKFIACSNYPDCKFTKKS